MPGDSLVVKVRKIAMNQVSKQRKGSEDLKDPEQPNILMGIFATQGAFSVVLLIFRCSESESTSRSSCSQTLASSL